MAAQAGLCLSWSQTPEDRFSHDEAHMDMEQRKIGITNHTIYTKYIGVYSFCLFSKYVCLFVCKPFFSSKISQEILTLDLEIWYKCCI